MFLFWSRVLSFVSIVISLFLGCVDCGAQSTTAGTASPVILPANTPVILHLKENLYKKDAKPGYSLEFEVGYDAVSNGEIVIQSGTAVIGSIRRVDRAGKGQSRVLIDLRPVQAVSGEMVRLASLSSSTNPSGGMDEAVGWGSEAPPILPFFVIASLFEKKVLLDKHAWNGVVQTVENVALDPAKQKAAQQQYIANRRAAQAELCQLLASPDSANWGRAVSLARRSGLGDSSKADLLRKAGDLDAAIEEYQQLVASRQDLLPCSDKYPELSSDAYLFFVFVPAVPEQRAQLLKLFKSSSANLHLELAGLYREKRDFLHAISECRTAVQLDPENETTRIGLISTLQDSGELDAAIVESKEAIRIWPDRPYFHYLLGTVLVKKNDADAAIAELQWVLNREKNRDWRASCALGSAYELKGDLKAALSQYRTAYRVHMDDQKCRAAYEQLKLRLRK